MTEQKRNYSEECGDFGGTNGDGDPCGRPAGWGTDFDGGKCKHHRGTNADGSSHENNGNAAKHNLYADRDKLYQRLPDAEQDHVDSLAAAYYDRYTERKGSEPDYAATQRLKNVAIDVHKETLADNYAAEQSDENDTHPLIEEQIIGQDENGRPIRVERPNQLIGIASGLKTDTRMWLKDMGLLDDGSADVEVNIHDEILSGLKRAYDED